MKNLISSDQPEFEQIFLKSMFDGFISKNIRYAVLRNYQDLPISIGARDIDIIVHPDDLSSACNIIDFIANDMNLLYANYFRDERLIQIALAGRDDNHKIQQIKIDFFTRSEVYGIELFSAEKILQNTKMHRGISVTSDLIMLADKWLFHLLIGKELHVKYDNIFSDIASNETANLTEILTLFLSKTRAKELISDLVSGKGSQIKLKGSERCIALFKLWFSQGLAAIKRTIQFINFRLRDYIFPHGIFISVSGPDGSGKTTVIEMIISQLEVIYGKNALHYFHYRPNILPRIAEVAKKVHLIKTVDKNYSKPHRASSSGFIGSFLRLCYYFFDYLIGYYKSIRPILRLRQIVIYDRYCFDLVADSARSRIALPESILRGILKFLPLPNYSFYISVDSNEIFHRKQELEINQIIKLNSKYKYLSKDGWLIEVDNNNNPDLAAANIVDHIIKDRNVLLSKKYKECNISNI